MRLPGILSEIADVAGEHAAIAIAQARGGTQVYFPPVPADDHWICRLIGKTAAMRVCDQMTAGVGPRRVDVPLGPTGNVADMNKKRATVDRMIIAGRSERDIALATGYTTRQVRRRRANLREDGQLSLF
tara:strand:- start:641 stop:1027 length:387 start_codon:yes stop_codon:yes gene_type:complete